MKYDKLDSVLNDIYSKEVIPSEELILRTKASIKKPGLLLYAIAASISLDVLGTFILIYMMLFSHQSILGKIFIYAAAAFIQNAVILVVWLYRERLRELFMMIEAELI